MATPRQFNQNMIKRAEEIEQAANLVKQDAALEIERALVRSTPVDTGRARSNWRIGTGRLVVQPTSPQQTISRALAKIRRTRPGLAITIHNNVSYIADLNAGSSRQAPANFVGAALLVGQANVQKAKLFRRTAGELRLRAES